MKITEAEKKRRLFLKEKKKEEARLKKLRLKAPKKKKTTIKKQKYIIVNGDDRTLDPFVIWLPKPPDLSTMDNFKVKEENRVFKRVRYPAKLKSLENRVDNDLRAQEELKKDAPKRTDQRFIRAVWKELLNNPAEYINELKFIRAEQWKLRYGHWVIIKDIATWIPPFMYRYMNYWTIDDVDEVEYRHRDWEFFIFVDWLYRTYVDEFGNHVYTNHPKTNLRRLLLGYLYPKHRRDGATHKALVIGYSILMESGARGQFGIQSYDETNAKKLYTDKFIPSFIDMPFFTRPLWGDSRGVPVSGLKFTRPSGVGAGDPLLSSITFKSPKEKGYDGEKLRVYLGDEGGKTVLADIVRRHNINRNTMAQGKGSNITGFAMYPSTVEDLDAMGGDNYKRLADDSYYKGARTTSWLVTFFKSAVYGLEGYIDKFGYSIVDDPKEEDLWRIPTPNRDQYGILRGARRFLLEDRKEKLASGDPKEVEEGVEDSQRFPVEYIDCWGNTSGDAGFDMEGLKKRKGDLMSAELHGAKPTRKGYFVWVIGGVEYTATDFVREGLHLVKGVTNSAHVMFIDDENGNFNLSLIPNKTNRRYVDSEGIWYPENPDEYTTAADPYKYLNRIQKKVLGKGFGGLSKGGISIFQERNMSVDPHTKDIAEWETYRFVGDYLWRYDTTEEMGEDFIMAMVYFGGMGFPEANVGNIVKYVSDRGFQGFLLKMTDINDKVKNYYGFYSNGESKQDLFQAMRTYVKIHIQRENHINIINDILDIKGIDDMTNRDLFTSAAGCLLGSKSRFREYLNEARKEENIPEDILDTFDF